MQWRKKPLRSFLRPSIAYRYDGTNRTNDINNPSPDFGSDAV